MEEKKQDYEKLVCSICKNKNICTRENIKVHIYSDDSISMRCPNYKYENSIL